MREAERELNGLPRETDQALKANLRDWLDHLDAAIAERVQGAAEPEETATPTRADRDADADGDADRRRRRPTADADPDRDADARRRPTTADPGTGGERPPRNQPGTGGVPPGGRMTADTLFADRYRLERRLGVGGMATVQLALDTRLERHVAVKLLAEHLADGLELRLALPARGARRRAARAPEHRPGLRLRRRGGHRAASSS